MSRSTSSGWGAAPVGGTYSLSHASPFSVNGSYGRVDLTRPGESESATIGKVSTRDVEVRVSVAIKALPKTGSGTYSSVVVRARGGRGYSATLRVAQHGIAYLSLSRLDGSPRAVTALTLPIRLRQNIIPGAFYNVAFSAVGDTRVAVNAKVWRSGTAEPGWQASSTDRTAKRVTSAGAVQLIASSSPPAELRYDNIKVTAVTAPPVKVPAPVVPTKPVAPTAPVVMPPPVITAPVVTPPSVVAPPPVVTPPILTPPTVTPPSVPSAPPVVILPPVDTTTASVSSAANANGALALNDGDVALGQTGAEWVAADPDTAPWAQLTFGAARTIASAQVFGTSTNWVNPAGTANAPEYGNLVFSDGSSVIVSGIAGGTGAATTVAFAPRSVTWVRLDLMKSDPQVKFGLREFDAYSVGITPPRWPSNTSATYAVSPAVTDSCSAGSAPFGSSSNSSPALVCPAPGSVVLGTATVVVSAPPATSLTATAWLPQANSGVGGVGTVGTAVADSEGRATFRIDASALSTGPAAVRVASGSSNDEPLYVQLDNVGGQPLTDGNTAPKGMTLQWNDDFTTPISVSQSGAGADYAATKPAAWGGSEFGDAVFADPARGLNTIDTVDGKYLRIRAQPSDPTQDPNGWGRTHTAGTISSLKVGASGFAAQYGYFEARILAPAGDGSWPAFWLLNSENAANRETPSSEVDISELYGQFTQGSCESLHAWNSSGHSASDCTSSNGASDWALSWHTYAAQVRPDRVDYYIDGRQVATIPGPTLTNEPFYFMLDLSLGGGWPINLTRTGDTIDMYVDWVRVYT